MKYTELQQKELLLKYISIKLSNELNNDINLEYIIKCNNKIITGTTLRNFNTTKFSTISIDLKLFLNLLIIFTSQKILNLFILNI